MTVSKLQAERSERGTVSVETVMTIPFFLITIIVVMKLALFGYTTLCAQWIASQVARELVVKTDQSASLRDTYFKNRVLQLSNVLGVSQYMQPLTDQQVCYFTPGTTGTLPSTVGRHRVCEDLTAPTTSPVKSGAGEGGDVILVQLKYRFTLFKAFPNFDPLGVLLTGEAFARNEELA